MLSAVTPDFDGGTLADGADGEGGLTCSPPLARYWSNKSPPLRQICARMVARVIEGGTTCTRFCQHLHVCGLK